jgi:hypothetical protein
LEYYYNHNNKIIIQYVKEKRYFPEQSF